MSWHERIGSMTATATLVFDYEGEKVPHPTPLCFGVSCKLGGRYYLKIIFAFFDDTSNGKFFLIIFSPYETIY